MNATSEARPILWHLPASQYSEKARWGLDHKQVPHARRSIPVPGLHILFSFALTGGRSQTFPVLQIDGRGIGDSSEIIAALEERFPEHPLYPEDPEQRRHALVLEDFFDEELGPHVRLLAFHEFENDRPRFEAMIARSVPPALARFGAGAMIYARIFADLRYGARDEQAVDLARAKIVAALDRIENELGSGDHLVGDAFSVADLSAAALFHPLVLPKDGPVPPDMPMPDGLASFRESLRERPGFQWVEMTYERYRQPVRAVALGR